MIMKTDFVKLIKAGNYEAFKQAVADENLNNLLTDEEEHILLLAPESWLADFLEKHEPSVNGEQVLISHRSEASVLFLITKYGLSDETIMWVIQSGTEREYSKVVPYMDDPDGKFEKVMLERNDADLLEMWLDNFSCLSEEGERLLEERPELENLKLRYIQGTCEC